MAIHAIAIGISGHSPTHLRNGPIFFSISSKRSWDHLPPGSTMDGSSILFTTHTSFCTPSVLASCACSRVCPPRSNPASNSPLRAEMTCDQHGPLLLERWYDGTERACRQRSARA